MHSLVKSRSIGPTIVILPFLKDGTSRVVHHIQKSTENNNYCSMQTSGYLICPLEHIIHG